MSGQTSGQTSGLTVRGGAGGTTATLDDLAAAAAVLREAGRSLLAVSHAVVVVARDPALLASLLAAPVTAVHAEATLVAALAGPHGVATCAGRVEALAVALNAAVAAYRGADRVVDEAVHEIDLLAGRAVGRMLANVVDDTVGPVVPAAFRAVLPMVATTLARPSVTLGSAAAQGIPPAGLATGDRFLQFLARHTGVTEHVVDAVPGFTDGLLAASPGASPVWSVGPRDARDMSALIGGLGGVSPVLRERASVRVTTVASVADAPPSGLGDIVTRIARSSPGEPSLGGGVTAAGTVRVEQITGADGARSWIVDIPGTHDWSPTPGADPFDLTSDVRTLAGRPSAAGSTVVQALRTAGARPTEPVLLAGHSLGGMVAAQLAADPAVRREFHITHVMTAGSPIALSGVPDGVQVLSLEHDDDLVPRLDGAVNPDRPGWVTVSRPATALAGGGGAHVAAPHGDTHPRLVVTHDADTYAQTAAMADASTDASVVAWREGLTPFLNRPGATAIVTEVVGERLP